MIKIKLIKTEKDYEDALIRLDALMDAPPDSPQEEELELLALIIEKYEKEHFPIELPDPVEAIFFRMEQSGLEPKDLIPFLGSQSKVSEVLNHKRPLSLTMIRNLQEGLGIPAEVLIQKPTLQETVSASHETIERDFSSTYFSCPHLFQEKNLHLLREWLTKISEKAAKKKLPPFDGGKVDETLFTELVRLSRFSAGPQMAGELLNQKGIDLVVQKISFETELDGACFFTPEYQPIIGLTLRKKQLVDFWFTLFHLLAHLYLHREEKTGIFFDSIECVFEKTARPEEGQVNEFLKKTWAPSAASKKNLQNYLKRGNELSLAYELQAHDISPEIYSCWLRLEKKDIQNYALQFTHKKVSEKLEIYE